MGLVPYPAVDRPEHPVVSVCIANYNGEALLDDCIASVQAQDAVESIEIIVHDDASTDGSVELLRSRYPGVELLVSTENVGFCIANNRMVGHARGEYVLLLNNDAALHPDAIRTLMATARAGKPGILTLPQYDWQTGALVDRGCLLDPFYNPVPNLDPNRQDVAYVIGACLWIPRAVWDELGGFPEWMESIGEDLYLGCIARLRGYRASCLSDSGYRHRQGTTFGGNRAANGRIRTTLRRRTLSERNKLATLVVCTPTLIAWPLATVSIVLLAMEGLALSFAARSAKPLTDVYAKAIRIDLDKLRERRCAVQASRSTRLRPYLACFVPWSRKLSLLRKHGWPRID